MERVERARGLEAQPCPDFLHGDVGDLRRHDHARAAALAAPSHATDHQRAVDPAALCRWRHPEQHAFALLGAVQPHCREGDDASFGCGDEYAFGRISRFAGAARPIDVDLVALPALEARITVVVAEVARELLFGDGRDCALFPCTKLPYRCGASLAGRVRIE